MESPEFTDTIRLKKHIEIKCRLKNPLLDISPDHQYVAVYDGNHYNGNVHYIDINKWETTLLKEDGVNLYDIHFTKDCFVIANTQSFSISELKRVNVFQKQFKPVKLNADPENKNIIHKDNQFYICKTDMGTDTVIKIYKVENPPQESMPKAPTKLTRAIKSKSASLLKSLEKLMAKEEN